MKTIKIIVGTFGYMPEGAKSVQIKDANSDPFDVSDAIAERLIGRGMAEIMAEAPDVVISYDDKMTKAQLEEIGKQIGVELTDSMTKAVMLKTLDAAIAAADVSPEDPEVEGDGEVPPTINPADLAL